MSQDNQNNVDILEENQKLPYTDEIEKKLTYIRDRITQLRLTEDNLSERGLGQDLGRGTSYIQQVTSGKITPSLTALFQICERFSLDPKEFFDPEISNPSTFHKAIDSLKKLSEDELVLLTQLIDKLVQNRQSDK